MTASAGNPVSLQLLGSTCLRGESGNVKIGTKPLALLSYLAVREGRHNRRLLAALLWPGVSVTSGLHSLSQALYTIRRTCGEGAVIRRPDTIALGRLECDLRLFRAARERTAWRAAAEHVGGALCADLQADSAPFDHWLDGARAAFLQEVQDLLPRLEAGFEWNLLLRLTQLVKDGLGPRDDLDRLEALATTALATGTVGNRGRPRAFQFPPIRPGAYPFVGRQQELAAAGTVLDRTRRTGATEVLVLSGPPGVGKSALADRIARLSALRGWRVAQAKGHQAESNLPLGVVEQLFSDPALSSAVNELPRDVRSAVSEILPSLVGQRSERSAGDPEFRIIRLFQAFRAALLYKKDTRPQLVVIDDFHWVDPSSKGLIHHLLGKPFDGGLLLILVTPTASEHSLRREFKVSFTLKLDGLSPAETEELLKRVGSHDRLSAASLHVRTGGNPLLLRALISDQPNESLGVAASAAEYFQKKFEGVRHDSRLYFAALAVLGGRAPPVAVAEVAGIDEAMIPQTLMDLSRCDLVSSRGDSIELVHGIAGDVVLADLSPVVRRLLYARAAKRHRARGDAVPAVLAVQLEIAGESDQAYEAALEAVAASERLSANREAEYFLKLALAHAPGSEEAGEARIRLAELYLRTGQIGRVTDALDWKQWDQCSAKAQLWAEVYGSTVALASHGQPDRAINHAWHVAEKAIEAGVPRAAAHLLMKIAPASSDIGRLEDVRRSAHTLIGLIDQLPEAYAMRCRGAAAAAIAITDSVAVAKELVEDLFLTATSPQDKIHYHGASALIHYAAGQLREAESYNLAALALSEQSGIYSLYVQILNNLSVCYIEMGRNAAAKDCLERALNYSCARAGGQASALVAYDNLGLIAFEERDYHRCIELLNAGAEVNRSVQSRRSAAASLGIRGLAYLEMGRLAEAFECERELRQIDDDRNAYLSDVSHIELFAARMHAVRLDYAAAAERLRGAIVAYQDRDPFARSRLQIELLKVRSRHRDDDIREDAFQLMNELVEIGAKALADQLAQLLTETS